MASQGNKNTSPDDLNPFAAPSQSRNVGQVRGASNPPATGSQPAVLQTSVPIPSGTLGSGTTNSNGSSAAPPSYQKSAAQTITAEDLRRRQEELDRKAAELAAREEALRRSAQYAVRENNWPPLPKVCPVGPCFYQDINVEIPVEFQKIVRYAYYLWMCKSSLP